MTVEIIGILAGGLGLFLLGMRLMTDGLKYAAGNSLRSILSSSTSTRLRGIASGAFITSLVQSSSAVTVATIGFVNAGLLDLSQAVAVVYGTNIGTTMTGWLVSLAGFHVNIKAFALPAIGIGMFMRVFGHQGKRGAFGDVLAGFGIFFVGIDILKTGFEGLEKSIPVASLAGEGIVVVLLFVGIGFLLTCLMQSSSAAIAIILTAAVGGVIPLYDAAAVVIGANVGTTSTAALAVFGATPNAKRLAGAHVIFNLVTGGVALLLLPVLLPLLISLQELLGFENSIATILALFHTTFNLLGVLILYPLTGTLVAFLQKRHRTVEEDEAVPKHLDWTIASTPALAMHAMTMELKRIGVIARRMAAGAISQETGPCLSHAADKNVIEKLIAAVGEFGNVMQRGNLPEELDNQLPNAFRVSGYYMDIAELSYVAAKIQTSVREIENLPELSGDIFTYKNDIIKYLKKADTDHEQYSAAECREDLERLKDEYRHLKARLLRVASRKQLRVGQLVHYLDFIAYIRRIAEQAEKGARYLAGMAELEDVPMEAEDLIRQR